MAIKHWDVYEVVCDGCQEVHDSSSDNYTEAEALESAKGAGWVPGREPGSIRCPHCVVAAGKGPG
jgi:hypothetical protein